MDLDAFFAAVEQRQKPSLRGKPVIVGGVGGRGVVATASYEARRFGVGSAMSTETARRRCPQGVFLSTRFEAYRQHSVAALAWLAEAGATVEQVAFDEAFVDLATVPPAWWQPPPGREAAGDGDPAAHRLAARVRSTIYARTGLTASVGVGRTKLTAKLGSELAKPAGVRVITAGDEADLLPGLDVRALWGVGPATATRLSDYGVNTVADLRRLDETDLRGLVGRAHGTTLYGLARGIDPRPVVASAERKSVGAEHTLPADVHTSEQLGAALRAAFTDAHSRLVRAASAARTVTVKVRYADFTDVSRSATVHSPTDDTDLLWETATRAASRGVDPGRGVRLVGVTFSALSGHAQIPLRVRRPESAGMLFGDLLPSGAGADEPNARSAPRPAPDGEPAGTPGDGAVPPVPFTVEDFRPGMDVSHPSLGAGWVVAVEGTSARCRFEGPDTAPAADVLVHATDGGLILSEPPPPSPRAVASPTG